jgi:hypothetical protein
MANKLHDLRAICLRKSDALDVTKVKGDGGYGGDARQQGET